MMRKIAKAVGLALLLMLALTSIVFAVAINWGAALPNPIYDETGVGNTLLADGDIVQLIWDVDGDGIDPPGQAGYPTDDDELLATSTIGTGAFPDTGTFSDNLNTTTVGTDSIVYVRAWNASSLSAATHYGDSPLFTINSDVAFTLDATASGSFATTSSKPTAVTLSSFTASPGQDEILLEWETASEPNLQGFNLYRAETPGGIDTGSYVQLNDALIPGEGDPILGASYSFPDGGVVAGVRYYYWLEDVPVGGVGTPHGPVDAALAGHRYYLPLVLR